MHLQRVLKYILWIALLLCVSQWGRAATLYVDSGCTNNGDGTAVDCAAGAGQAGPFNDATTATVGGVTCGNTVEIRGVHATHASNHAAGTTTGRYFMDYIDINNKNCAVDTPIVIQPYGYTGVGTGEVVYMDATSAPTWTQCAWDGSACDCDAGNQNVVIGAGGQPACEATWYITGSGIYDKALGFQKPDGSPTYRVAQRQCAVTTTTKCSKNADCPGGADLCTGFDTTMSLALMTNSSAGYNAKACSDVGAVDYTWMRCNTDDDCPASSTCTAAQSAEIDSFTTEASGGVAFARWGATPTGATHRVLNNSTGISFLVRGTSSFITVRGFNHRAHVREAVSFDTGTADCTASDNTIYYSCYQKNSGPDYGLAIRKASRITLTGNHVAYTTSEGIHTQNLASGATVYTISDNWIHDIGDQNVLGPQCSGTPSGVIMGDDYQGGDGNYTGSVFSGNLTERTGNHYAMGGSGGRGLIIENDASGLIVRNNVWNSITSECLKFDGGVATNSNQVYNNLMVNCGTNPGASGGGGTCIYIFALDASSSTSSNLIYNNTLSGCANDAIVEECHASATCASNLIRNNILAPATGQKGVHFPTTTATNLFTNNLVVSDANPAATFLNVSKACAAISDLGAGNVNDCPDPVFTSATDFHIQTTSPAKDAGTSTGMPAGRTTDINNTIASTHGLADYSDGEAVAGAVDIGADEFPASSVRRSLIISRYLKRISHPPATEPTP